MASGSFSMRVGLLLGLLLAVTVCGEVPEAGGMMTIGDEKTLAVLRAVPSSPKLESGFLAELRQAGWVDRRNLTILAGDPEEVYPDPEEVEGVVRAWRSRGVDLLVALSSRGARVAMETAPEVPLLFLSNDPTATGLIEDEQEPEGMATGVTFRVPADRTLDLVRRGVPGLGTVGLLYPRGDPTAAVHRTALEEAAAELDLNLVGAAIGDPDDVNEAVSRLAEDGAEAIVVSHSPAMVPALDRIKEAAERHALPVAVNLSIAPWALVSVFPDPEELGRQLGRQAVRLLGGSSPGAVPVEDPRRFGVRINLETASRLGIEVPTEVVREATEVISP